ncbi:MAG: hypothetical protein WAP03_21835 [Methylorubrum rhodinum]|uniref:hypothetical protein n=1 Tax=Methylorubrum rhodinum TaxID=29428 RepID=UPI003BB17921
MTAPRFTIRHDERPAVALDRSNGGFGLTTFGHPRTLTLGEIQALRDALTGLIEEAGQKRAAAMPAKTGAGA